MIKTPNAGPLARKPNIARTHALRWQSAGLAALIVAAGLCVDLAGASRATAQTASAGSTATQVGEVVVTGRLEQDVPVQLAKQGVRVDVVTASEIKNAQYVDVAQSLQTTVPGLYVAPKNGPFDYVQVSLQGSRTEDVLWLVDGVRINNRLYGGTTPLDTLPASMVDRIEAWRDLRRCSTAPRASPAPSTSSPGISRTSPAAG